MAEEDRNKSVSSDQCNTLLCYTHHLPFISYPSYVRYSMRKLRQEEEKRQDGGTER